MTRFGRARATVSSILGISEPALFFGQCAHHTTAKELAVFWPVCPRGVLLVRSIPSTRHLKTRGRCQGTARPGEGGGERACRGCGASAGMSIGNAAGVKNQRSALCRLGAIVTAALTRGGRGARVGREALQYMQAKKLRPVVASEVEAVDIPGIGKVEAITDTFPDLKKVLPMPQLLGIAIPIDTPAPIKEEITKAFDAAMKSDRSRRSWMLRWRSLRMVR